MANFKPTLALFCDDARREENGQYFLVGVIGAGALGHSTYPTSNKTMKVYVLGEAHAQQFEVEYRVIKSGASKAICGGNMNFQRLDGEREETVKIDFDVDLKNITFPEVGEYHFQIRESGQRWKSIASVSLINSRAD